MFDEEMQHDVPEQTKRSDHVGGATSGFIFKQTCILTPMVSDFHSTTMTRIVKIYQRTPGSNADDSFKYKE